MTVCCMLNRPDEIIIKAWFNRLDISYGENEDWTTSHNLSYYLKTNDLFA